MELQEIGFMASEISVVLNQIGLVLGMLGSVALAFSAKVGVIQQNGTIAFTGLDPMDPVDVNKRRVISSHWRNRWLTPIGWLFLGASFALQFLATYL